MTLAAQLTTDLEAVFYQTDDFAELVSIKRNNQTTASVAVIFDDWKTEAKGAGMPLTTSVCPAISLPTTAYVIGSGAVDPRRGDVITRANGEKYEVIPVDGKRCYEPHNDAQEIIVFLKKVSG